VESQPIWFRLCLEKDGCVGLAGTNGGKKNRKEF